MSCYKLQQVLCLTQRFAKQQFFPSFLYCLIFVFLLLPTQPPLNLTVVFKKLCRFQVLLIVFIKHEFKFENRLGVLALFFLINNKRFLLMIFCPQLYHRLNNCILKHATAQTSFQLCEYMPSQSKHWKFRKHVSKKEREKSIRWQKNVIVYH